jgi:hypothetical protein
MLRTGGIDSGSKLYTPLQGSIHEGSNWLELLNCIEYTVSLPGA